MQTDRLKGNLDLLLLACVARTPGHGYAIIARLREQSAEAFDLPEGTVYPALHQLEKAGLLTSTWVTEAGRKRKLYRLTDSGAKQLAAEERSWRSFTTAVGLVLGGEA